MLVQALGGGGSPTPVPLTFPSITLRLDPTPIAVPQVAWRSNDESIVVVRQSNPLEGRLFCSDDTAATPPPDPLRMMLVPGPFRNGRWVGDSVGVTRIEADIGAPVNERVSIPVYTTGNRPSTSPRYRQGANVIVTPLSQATRQNVQFSAAIAYADPVTPTYGPTKTIFTEVPWQPGAGGFRQVFGTVRVALSPQPYNAPDIRWTVDGDSASIHEQHFGTYATSEILRGEHPGTAVLHAKIGAPVNRDVSFPLVTYPTLVLPCNQGLHFTPNGAVQFSTARDQSDVFLTCGSLLIPRGAVMLTNGDDPSRAVANGAIRGAQFPELDAAAWTNAFTVLDMERYRAAIAPCSTPESPGVVRLIPGCRTMAAHTLLFRTRDGRYVKWLLQVSNGLDVLAGPYQVL